jgi:hypothetical protein
MPYEPINLGPGEHLGWGRGPNGGRVGLIFQDGTNKLLRHAAWAEVGDYGDRPQQPTQPRQLTPEEEAIAQALAELLVLAVVKLTPVVKRWWEETLLPAAKSLVKRILESIRAKRSSIEQAEPSLVYIAIKTDSKGAMAETEITMTKAEWASRYQVMLDASQFSDEQRRLLSVARIVEAEGDASAELTPQDFAERIQLKIEANPVLLEEKRAAEVIRAITSDGGRRALGQ